MHWTEITCRHRGGVVVIDLRGQLSLDDDARRLMPVVSALLEQGHRRILLNLQYLPSIDSMGIGEIVGVYSRAARFNAELALCEVSSAVRMILDVTNLDAVLRTLEDEDSAVTWLQSFPRVS